MELMDMPFKNYYCLYKAAWLESEARAAEMEAAEKKEKAEAASVSRSQSRRGGTRMSQEEILNRLHGVSSSGGDLEDVMEDLM